MDPAICSLDEQLKAFVSRHSATFSSIVKGDLPCLPWFSCSSLGAKLLSGSCMPGVGEAVLRPAPSYLWPVDAALVLDSRSKSYALSLTYRRV